MLRCLLLLVVFIFTHAKLDAQLFFEVNDPSDAELKIFYVEDEAQCDLRVCFVYTEKEAQNPAHWCETGDPALADITLCMISDTSEAQWFNQKKKEKFKIHPD